MTAAEGGLPMRGYPRKDTAMKSLIMRSTKPDPKVSAPQQQPNGPPAQKPTHCRYRPARDCTA